MEQQSAASALERHYRVKELVVLWGFCRATVVGMFAGEPGILRIESGVGGKRKYETISIPESVLLRVHQRFSQQPLKADLPARRPPAVMSLRDLRAGVPKKAADILQVHPRKQLLDRERIA